MKHVKKLFAMLMAVMMLVGLLSVTSFAADGKYTISVKADNTRSYKVYQIMTGDLSTKDDGKEVLSNVQWGQNALDKTGAVSNEEMTAITSITGTDAEKAAKLAKYVDFSKGAFATVSKDNSAEVVPGYYLIEDNGPVADKEAYSLYIVQVVGNTVIDPKVGTTSSEKKVDDKNDSNTNEDAINWQDSADYDIGDQVPFQLKATICQDYDNYENGYKLTFHDKESAGLTFNKDSVKVYVDGNEITAGFEVVTTGLETGCTFEVRFANLKDITAVKAGSVIRVEYTSKLNENAVIGAEGNPNTSHITYTNNPNVVPEGGNIPEGGKTPDDTVIVFNYQVNVNKYANEVASGNELKGAGFALYKKVLNPAAEAEKCTESGYTDYVLVGKYNAGDATKFEFKGIDDGDYVLVETTTPAGYNTVAPIAFTVSATHDELADAPKLNTLTVNPDNIFKVQMVEGTATPTGYISGDVVNQAGSTLPETGGMGTYIFYAVGGVLVLAAVVLFVTKKRMSNAD